VRAIISTFGQLKAFTLVRDAGGQSTGTALAEFADPSVLNAAIAGLSVVNVGPERLAVGRAANQEHVLALQQLIQQQQAALMQRLTGKVVPGAAAVVALPSVAAAIGQTNAAGVGLPPPPAEAPPAAAAVPAGPAAPAAAAAGDGGGLVQQGSMARADSAALGGLCVVRLECMVTREELQDDEDYDDILDETREEVAKYGPLKQVRSPAAQAEQTLPPTLEVPPRLRRMWGVLFAQIAPELSSNDLHVLS